MDYQVTWNHLTMDALRILTNELPGERFDAGPDDLLADGSYTCRDPQSKNSVRLTYRRWPEPGSWGTLESLLTLKITVVLAGALIAAEFELDGDDLIKRDIDYFSEMFIKPVCYAIADRIRRLKGDDCTAHRAAH